MAHRGSWCVTPVVYGRVPMRFGLIALEPVTISGDERATGESFVVEFSPIEMAAALRTGKVRFADEQPEQVQSRRRRTYRRRDMTAESS